jgi:DNA-binding transcriptional LysR family regulator
MQRALRLSSEGGLTVIEDFEVMTDVAAGRLVRMPPDWMLTGGAIYAIFPATRYRPLNTRVLIDALKMHIAQQAFQSSVRGNRRDG